MQHWQLPFLGLHEFPADLTEFEIRYFFTFTPHERQAIVSRDGDHRRLAAAVHLGFIKMTGRTLDAFAVPSGKVLRQGLYFPQVFRHFVPSLTDQRLSEPSLASWRLASRRTSTFQGQLFHPRHAPPWRDGPRARGLPAQATGFSTHDIMALPGAQRKYSQTPWLMISAGKR